MAKRRASLVWRYNKDSSFTLVYRGVKRFRGDREACQQYATGWNSGEHV